jgi:hypothetical protein
MFPECSLSPTFMPVLSTSPIDYYDGGTVRLNTEFYSWDTSFRLVNPRLRYSCLQVVFCVNLGTFFLSASCSWDGGSRASAQLSLNVPCTYIECSLNVPCACTERSLNVPCACTERSLNVPCACTERSLNVPCACTERSLNVPL